VTGNAGAGKTTLATTLGQALDLPVFHLDSIVWQPGWRKTPPDERDRQEAELIEGQDWVIDGVSDQVRGAADLVVFLDVPRYRCLGRVFRRNLPYLFRSRPGLPAGCPEILIIPRLIRMILRFPHRVRARIRSEASSSVRFRWIRSAEDMEQLGTELGLDSGGGTSF
jgi:adenylate kinase family enzyme